MQIASLAPGFRDTGTVGRRSDAGQAIEGKTKASVGHVEGGPSQAMEILAEIVGSYDLRDITPRDFSDMLRKLRDSGVLSETEYRDLSQIRLDLDEANIDADESIDLLDFYRKLSERARGSEDALGGDPATASGQLANSARQRLEWLEKVAILQESPEAAGLNALV